MQCVVTAVILALGVIAFVYLTLNDPRSDAPTDRQLLSADTPGAELPRKTGDKLRIGWTAWADAEIVSHLAARLLESRLGQPVQLVMADIGLQYQSVASGNLDVMLMAWLPRTHAPYWHRYATEMVNLGPIYTRARLGWAVPAYVPVGRLRSINDLKDPDLQARIGARIQGIDPGSGLMQASEEALDSYGLTELELVSSSGAAMTAALDSAIRDQRWIVVTAWSPHWMFARWQLRYLEDPLGILGKRERVHVLVRRGFYEDFAPEITEFLSRFYIPLDELEAAMLEATNSSLESAIDGYIENHEDRIDYWLHGELN